MPRSSHLLLREMAGHFKYLDATRSKMERLFDAGEVVRRDIELVYCGLYLDAVTTFERFIEDLFLGLLVGRLRNRINVNRRFQFTSPTTTREIVHNGKNYIDWLPYSITENRADIYFTNGRPFSNLNTDDKRKLDKISVIRNAIAHKSNHSNRQFSNRVIAGLTLTSREKTPAGFLRSRYSAAPPLTQYQNIISTMLSIGIKLTN